MGGGRTQSKETASQERIDEEGENKRNESVRAAGKIPYFPHISGETTRTGALFILA